MTDHRWKRTADGLKPETGTPVLAAFRSSSGFRYDVLRYYPGRGWNARDTEWFQDPEWWTEIDSPE